MQLANRVWVIGLSIALLVTMAGAHGALLAQGPTTAAPQGRGLGLRGEDVGTVFTYQGKLTDGGVPANGAYDFEFRLYDAASGGTQVGNAVVKDDVAVANGLFSTELNFGPDAFSGQMGYLQIGVRPGASTGAHTALSPRQALNAAPYAISLRPGAVISGRSNSAITGVSSADQGSGLVGVATDTSGSGYGVAGFAEATSGETHGVFGKSDSTRGTGVGGWAAATSGQTYGVVGRSDSTAGMGVDGFAAATSGQTYGVFGRSDSTAGTGVAGFGGGTGVHGQTSRPDGSGVVGVADNGSGAYGVWGRSTGGFAGYFTGRVYVTGDIGAGGAKPFVIDHPLDPANKTLSHAAVEAPEVLNLYSGVAVLDAEGSAVVTLPSYFSALNTGEFRYQLTPIGAPMPNLYIVQEVQGNAFQIAGGVAGKKVSWQVTGVRNDAYMQQHPFHAEQDKPEEQRGLYLQPKEHGQPETLGVDYAKRPESK